MIKSRARLFLASLALGASILGYLQIQSVIADDDVEIEGQVYNATEGADIDELLEVSLTYVDYGQVVIQKHTMADKEGRFRFVDLPGTGGPLAFFLEVSYRGVSYTLEGIGDDLVNELRINVYETTPSLFGLRFLDSNLVLVSADARENKLGMLSALRLENSSDSTFIVRPEEAGSNDLLFLPLPSQASAVRVEPRDLHIIQTRFGIVIASPIPPGIHELLVTYEVPFHRSAWAFQQPFPIATDVFHLLVPNSIATVESVALQFAGTAMINDVQYDQFSGFDYESGEDVNITLTGLPLPSAKDYIYRILSGDRFRRGFMPSVIAGLFFGIVVYALVRRRSLSGDRSPVGRTRHEKQSALGEQIIKEVVKLDQAFTQGKVNEGDYRRYRDELKSRYIEETGEASQT